MVDIPHNEEHRPEVLAALLRAYPHAALVWTDEHGGLQVQHLPMCVEGPAAAGKLTLCARVAAEHPLAQGDARQALAIFQGAQNYAGPAQPGGGQPWNRLAVHARGRISLHDEPAWLQQHLTSVATGPSAAPHTVWQGCRGLALRVEHIAGSWSTAPDAHAVPRVAAMLSSTARPQRRQAV